MKKVLSALIISLMSFTASAQSTAGLIAHWDMNGTTNDVSGNGHNGHGNNITPAVGMDGVMGHGWYFNGVNSSITIPYSPALNVSAFTISAVLKVEGYYLGTCHGNELFARGTTGLGATGTYQLAFTDYPAGYGCLTTAYDTTQESFIATAFATGTYLGPSTFTDFNATPHIMEDQWYTTVVTFNDTVYNIYVNNVLVASEPSPYPGMSMGVSTDSASIGYCIYDAASGYPYGFHGIIDDIRIYNRALTDSEIIHLGDTCGRITVQPVSASTSSGGSAIYTVGTSIAGAAYQWQQDAGTGFASLTNSGPYSGVYTNTLTITGVTSSMSNYHYRCLISNSIGCADTSVSALLTTGVDNLSLNNAISVYPNPAKNNVAVILPYNNMQGTIQLFSDIGQLVIEKNINSKTNDLDLDNLPAGIYFIKIQCEGQIVYKKVTKY